MYSTETINELNQLSKEVFGTKSRWRKLVEKGEPVLVTEETTQFDPGANGGEGETKTVEVAVLHHGSNGGKCHKYTQVYHTAETVKTKMLEIKKQLDQIKTAIAEQQKLKQAEEEAKKLVATASGSAI